MTELAELRRLAEAARTVEHTVGVMRFTLRLPTPHEITLAAARVPAVPRAELVLRTARPLVAQAIIAWEGVRESDLAPSAPEEPLPASAEAAELLFDARPDVYDDLRELLFERISLRHSQIEGDAKN